MSICEFWWFINAKMPDFFRDPEKDEDWARALNAVRNWRPKPDGTQA